MPYSWRRSMHPKKGTKTASVWSVRHWNLRRRPSIKKTINRLSNLSVAVYVVLVGNQLLKSQWPAVVQLVGADGQFGTDAHGSAVSEPRGCVVVHGSAVYLLHENIGLFLIRR